MFKRKVLISALIVIFLLGLVLAGFIKKNYVVPIIMYHSVLPAARPENKLEISTSAFERQMRFLKAHRYNVMPLSSLANLIKEKKKIPHQTLAITFDDGYSDNYIYAFPILKKYRLPATVFLVVDMVGGDERLDWGQIRQMQNSGLITFGSHTLNHTPLVEIKSDEELRRQIFGSKRELEEKIKRPVDIFSYPVGAFNPKIRQLVMQAGYKAAVATNPGKNYPSDDVFALKRLRISRNCDNLFVFWFETSGIHTFIKEHQSE